MNFDHWEDDFQNDSWNEFISKQRLWIVEIISFNYYGHESWPNISTPNPFLILLRSHKELNYDEMFIYNMHGQRVPSQTLDRQTLDTTNPRQD